MLRRAFRIGHTIATVTIEIDITATTTGETGAIVGSQENGATIIEIGEITVATTGRQMKSQGVRTYFTAT